MRLPYSFARPQDWRLRAFFRPEGSLTDDAYQFLESARTSDDYLYAAYVLIVVMGLRKGEVLGLTGRTSTLTARS